MKEISSILDAYNSLDSATTQAALATVVRVEGSSYRRTGARMLIMDNGNWIGGISGGCLEGDALKRARLAIAAARPTLVTYDTTEDDAYQIGVGLGCNGIIDVLIAPLNPAIPGPLDMLNQCAQATRQTHTLLTVTRLTDGDANKLPIQNHGQPGPRQGDMIRYEDRESLTVFDDEAVENQLEQTIRKYVSKGKSASVQLDTATGQSLEVFIEIIPPVPHVILMGQQYDAVPLVRIINELGWQCTLIANPQKVTQTLFASANAIVPPDEFDSLTFDDHTAIVLMAHDFKTDKANLPKALATGVPFVGILGPRVRSERMVSELAGDGVTVSLGDARIHAPVGVDIGAASPEEISLSIVAEIRAALSGRDGAFLRLRPTTIHERE